MRLHKKVLILFCFALAAVFNILFTGSLQDVNVLQNTLELELIDFTYRNIPLRDPNPKIAIAGIDDVTIEEYGWPFSRKYHAQLLTNLTALGAKVVAFDILFLEKSAVDEDGDKLFLEAVTQSGNAVNLALLNKNVISEAEEIHYLQFPFEDLAQRSKVVAVPNVDVDYVRNIRLFFKEVQYYDTNAGVLCSSACVNIPVASLSMAAYSAYKDIPLNEIYPNYFKNPKGLINFTAAATRIKYPARNDGQVLTSLYPHISAGDILSGSLTQAQKNLINGSVIFVGHTAVATIDNYKSPFDKHTAGVEFHANALDNLLAGDFTKEAEPWLIYFVTTLFAFIPLFMGRVKGFVLVIFTMLIWCAVYLAGYFANVHINFTMPAATLMVSYIVCVTVNIVSENKEKRWIRKTFEQYLAPSVVEKLQNDSSQLKLGGEKKDMTVWFLDIAGFTSISETLEPQEVSEFLNRYLSALSNEILDADGVIDKYIGDAIMAFWNAPLDVKEHRAKAAVCAVKCKELMKDLTKDYEGSVAPSIRIGLNAGEMVVGNMGSDRRFAYTVIGDNVNLASRLESANKYFGSVIMISESVYEEAKEKVLARKLGAVKVVGKNKPVNVYEPLYVKGAAAEQTENFVNYCNEGCSLYESKRFIEAKAAFEKALALNGGDKVCINYIKWCSALIGNPPPAEWTPVFNLTSK